MKKKSMEKLRKKHDEKIKKIKKMYEIKKKLWNKLIWKKTF